MVRIGGLMLDVNPEDNGTSKAWDDWIKRIEKTIRGLDALNQETEDFVVFGKDAEAAAEGMAKAIEIMEAMPQKGQGGLAVIAAHLREAGAEGIDLTHQLAALFTMIIDKTSELKDLKAFPKILEAQTFAVENMFDKIRAKTAGAFDVISGVVSPEDLSRVERLNELIEALTDHLTKIHANPDTIGRIVRQLTTEFNLLTAAEKAAKEVLDDAAKDRTVAETIGKQIIEIQKETKLIGMTNNERVRANDLMELEAHRASLSSEQFEFMAQTLSRLRDEQDKLNQSWAVGARQALMQYAEDAKNTAQQMSDWFTGAFRQMEDVLLAFVRTGKLNISALADWMITEFARVALRQLNLGPLAAAIGAQFPGLGALGLFGGGGAAAMGSGAAANVGAYANMAAVSNPVTGFATGSEYIPRNMLAFLHKGERVVSASENAKAGAGIGGGLVYAPVINIDSRTDRAEVYALVNRAVRKGNTELVERLSRAGAI
jgi:lambda family phage tail tape measure protein